MMQQMLPALQGLQVPQRARSGPFEVPVLPPIPFSTNITLEVAEVFSGVGLTAGQAWRAIMAETGSHGATDDEMREAGLL